MSLPKFSHPQFELVLPSTGQTIHYRPFLVKEEKVLLIAQAGGNKTEIFNAIKQIIQNCIVTSGIDVNTFATFDFEYFFLKLRSKSVSNIVELSYRDLEDDNIYKFEVDLDTVSVQQFPDHTNVIELPEGFKIKMRYPSTSILEKISAAETQVQAFFLLVRHCIDLLYRDNEVYKFDDYSDQEIEDFITTLPVNTLVDMRRFVDTMPKIVHELTYKNGLGNERKIVLQSLDDFFTLG